MPLFNLHLQGNRNKSLTKQQEEIYELVITEPPIHSYLYSEQWVYVVRLSKYVYIHYMIDCQEKEIIINWSLSHAVTHITIQ